MNRNAATFELGEMVVHANELIKKIDDGYFDDDECGAGYAVFLEHIMNHLARAWHCSKMTDEKINSLTQDQFDLLCSSIPKLNIENQLVETWEEIV